MVDFSERANGSTASHTRTFNAMNQMVSDEQSGVGKKTISYDKNGNMLEVKPAAGSGAKVQAYEYNQGKLMTTACEGACKKNSYTATFENDGNNDRLTQNTWKNGKVTGETKYTNDTIGLTQVLVSDGGAGSVVYHLYGNSHIGQQVKGSSQFRTHITDGLGSVRAEMETSGRTNYARTFSPFGETLAESGTSNSVYGYTGQQEDEATGLIYLRARYYNADIKTFMGRDGFKGRGNQPITFNGYVYAYQNPILYTDPSGFDAWWYNEAQYSAVPNPEAYQVCQVAYASGQAPFQDSDYASELGSLPAWNPNLQRLLRYASVDFHRLFIHEEGRNANWTTLTSAWFWQTSPAHLGEWVNENGVDVLIIDQNNLSSSRLVVPLPEINSAYVDEISHPGLAYIQDLKSEPTYHHLLNLLQREYCMTDFSAGTPIQFQDSFGNTRGLYETGFSFENATNGSYDALSWFLGSYRTQVTPTIINADESYGEFTFTVTNTSDWFSATRYPADPGDTASTKQSRGALINRTDPRSEAYLGGQFKQKFIWQDRIYYGDHN